MKARGKKLICLLLLGALALGLLFGCGGEKQAAAAATGPEWSALAAIRQVPLKHATQFSLTEYEQGYTLLDIPTSGRFLIVPQGAGLPRGLDDDVVPLYAPLDRMYLAATSSMDFFRALDSVPAVRLSGTDVNGWYIEEAKAALEDGSMIFAGKYSAPDYELIFAEKCDLAIESTMIYHSPEVKEQLEKLGVPVLVERSSYEEDPLGRMEWVKVYGALLGKLPTAEELFDGEVEAVEPLLDQPKTGKTVAFFYITTTGTVNVRKSSDYVPRMIALAGGDYAFPDLSSGSALSTVNMTMESFYDGARDADVLIYNSTIDGELFTLSELLQKSAFLKDFKAVQTGNVWCTGKNLFQEPMGFGKLILDMHRVLTDENAPEELTYLHKLTDGGK
jgi:iron complex transport system substrate-binding protein